MIVDVNSEKQNLCIKTKLNFDRKRNDGMDLELELNPTGSGSTGRCDGDDGESRLSATAAYKQCMKNHAATIGGHAVDGCREYMAAADSAELNCAACGCHRNFHRRYATVMTPPFLDFRGPPERESCSLASPPHLMLGPGAAAEETIAPDPVRGKRARTKFSREQKERMRLFSEKHGWKLNRSDESAVEEFCREIGVSEDAFRIWIHNNKTAVGRKKINRGR